MARFRIQRIFNYPVDDCVKLFLDSGEEAYDMQKLENVTAWKVIKEVDDGVKRVGTKEWCAHGQIPKAAQHIVSPKMLTFLEHSVWDRGKKVYSFEIEPHYLSKHVSCKGKTTYKAQDADKMLRIFEVELKINFPIIGQLVENTIIDYLKKNEEQDYRFCLQAMEIKFGRK